MAAQPIVRFDTLHAAVRDRSRRLPSVPPREKTAVAKIGQMAMPFARKSRRSGLAEMDIIHFRDN
jgi:hypothetical protein